MSAACIGTVISGYGGGMSALRWARICSGGTAISISRPGDHRLIIDLRDRRAHGRRFVVEIADYCSGHGRRDLIAAGRQFQAQLIRTVGDDANRSVPLPSAD